MASVTKRPNGHKWVQFVDEHKRKTIRLGKVSKRFADKVKSIVEELQAARIAQYAVLPDTAKWLLECPDWLHQKLEAVGLAEERVQPSAVKEAILATHLEGYIDDRRGSKAENTIAHYERVRGDLVKCFGESCDMSNITKADVQRFRLWYEKQGYAENTINRRIGRAKQFWQAAIDAELLTDNPFTGQDVQVRPNEEKFYFVQRTTIEDVLSVVPCPQWRLVIALARHAGLRVCELFALQWSHVDWEQLKVKIDSPKTGPRFIPLFAEIKPYLVECREQAGDDAKFVITRFPNKNSNLRTQFGRWCEKAGVTMWVKPFQNMRSSCEIDLNQQGYPQHTVASWMGHSENVAVKHYLRTTNDEFRRAAGLLHSEAKGEAANPGCEAKGEADSACRKQTLNDKWSAIAGNPTKNATVPRETDAFKAPPAGLEPATRRLTAACSTN